MPLPLSNLYVHRHCHRWWLYHPFCPKSSHLRTKEDVQQTTRRLGPRSVCEESRSATPTSPWRPPVHWSRKCHHTSPHCWWPPATSPPPLGESCTHRPCHPHPSCPLLKGPDDQDYCIPLKYILSQTWRFSSTIPNRYKPHSTSLHQVYHTTAGFKMSHRSNAKYLKKGQFV